MCIPPKQIDLSTVAYHSSQPWPFPQSLMIGMEAEAVWEDPRAGVNMEADPLAFIGNPTSSLVRSNTLHCLLLLVTSSSTSYSLSPLSYTNNATMKRTEEGH